MGFFVLNIPRCILFKPLCLLERLSHWASPDMRQALEDGTDPRATDRITTDFGQHFYETDDRGPWRLGELMSTVVKIFAQRYSLRAMRSIAQLRVSDRFSKMNRPIARRRMTIRNLFLNIVFAR